MTAKKTASLRGLIGKLMFSVFLALLGAWGLVIVKLDNRRLQELMAEQPYVDLGQLVEALPPLPLVELLCWFFGFLGLFMTLYYRFRLGPRLARIESLSLDRF